MEKGEIKLVVIGGSAGSLEVLLKILPALNLGFSIPVVIVLHRKNTSDSVLAELLQSKIALPVHEVEEKEKIEAGTVYIAPADYHLLFEEDGTFSLDYSEKVHYSRPGIDVSFESAAGVYGSSLLAILLSGASSDGADGFGIVMEKGGVTIAQDPDTAEVSYMPAAAIAKHNVSYVLNVEEITAFLNAL